MDWQQIEPRVIDEEMLQNAIQDQGPKGQAADIARKEGIKYQEVTELRLDYRSILKIYHLWSFTSLTKLQLDNNLIRRIEGLENLTNLLWLDLSFNSIEAIEGLNSLVKLQDLSLFNNCISVIENLDMLRNLHILSLGNNSIHQLENVVYLRKFKSLRTLNLSGNPICDDKRYKTFVTAYLPDLVYLDYRLLDEQTHESASVEYQYAIEEMQQNELQEQQAIDAQKIKDEEFQLHKDAFVENLNGPQLFQSLFEEDPDADKLALLPGIEDLLESFGSKMEVLCVQIFDAGLNQHTRRIAEVQSFFSCSQEAVTESKQRAAQIAAQFEQSRRRKMIEMQQITDAVLIETYISSCLEEANQLSETLMSVELQLVDQLECRDLENQHHEQLQAIALDILDKVMKNELEDDIPDDLAMLLVDKDTVTNAVSASHDTHLLKIDNREDQLLTQVNGWMNGLLQSISNEEVKRNRKRVSEIRNYITFVKEELESALESPSFCQKGRYRARPAGETWKPPLSAVSLVVSHLPVSRESNALLPDPRKRSIMPVRTECGQGSSLAYAASASLVPPPPINTHQPGVNISLLYSGSRFRGYQKSKGNSYDVEVVLQHVTMEDSYLCGYLKIKGLTEEYPTLTTFFAGEIISKKRPFLTRKWDADEDVDRKHWGKFQAFYQYAKSFNSDDFDYEDLKNSDYVFMRWKEQFLVPDHTIKDISGASFAGFYYICFQKSTATIEGYYYHRSSEWYQSLNLTHVPEHSVPIYEFR
ncbi:hypothetical protein DNTS_001235 [Danionella cerebrum]|uniref:Leucine-rich repeat-containing protein 48 n=1 Tax=Danionella cerebrum TaxID=2873325 RepID=A0A553R9V8_9TELE|nr:hypothetical protein DNTS_001235 [Danionella translucida]